MKIFINKREGLYNGGIIIVAANTVEEAQKILFETFPDEVSMYDADEEECFDEKECVKREHWNYKSSNWIELLGVTASYENPVFLAESGYGE